MPNTYRRNRFERAGARVLGAAEGVLVALCGFDDLDDAFLGLVAAAKRHNVAPLALAAAVVALAEDPDDLDCDPDAALAAGATWAMLGRCWAAPSMS